MTEAPPEPASRIATLRRWLLRIHCTVLAFVAVAAASATTFGWRTGDGLFGFMHQTPLIWVGFIQAYLLMLIIAVMLVLGASQTNARKWNIIGAAAHCPPLLAAFSNLDVFASMHALPMVKAAIGFHAFWFCLEATAALLPNRPASPEL
jgi:hypothetical protein